MKWKEHGRWREADLNLNASTATLALGLGGGFLLASVSSAIKEKDVLHFLRLL